MTRIHPSSTDRLPKFKRVRTGRPTFVLQPRDIDLVRLVADYRIVSADTLQALVPGSTQVLSRRLQRLFHAGLLDRPRRQVRANAPMVYALGARGAELLGGTFAASKRDWAEKNRVAGLSYIEHALMLSRFRASVTLAAQAHGRVEVDRWIHGADIWDDVRVCHSDWTERIPVAPDALLTLRLTDEVESQSRVHAFVEVDRSTMTTARYVTKLRGYWHYWRTGKLEQRLGIKNALVITLTRSAERAENLREKARLVDPGRGRGLRMFLFTDEGQFSPELPEPVLERIWATPDSSALHGLLE